MTIKEWQEANAQLRREIREKLAKHLGHKAASTLAAESEAAALTALRAFDAAAAKALRERSVELDRQAKSVAKESADANAAEFVRALAALEKKAKRLGIRWSGPSRFTVRAAGTRFSYQREGAEAVFAPPKPKTSKRGK